MAEQDVAADLDLRAEVRLVNDEDGLALVLADEFGVAVRIAVPRSPESWRAVRKLALQIEHLVPEVRAATVGYQHGPLTGPVPWPRG